jgi:hypothetical protein
LRGCDSAKAKVELGDNCFPKSEGGLGLMSQICCFCERN